MSKVTKRKHVTKEVTEEFALPEDGRKIVKVLSSKGNNLHEVQSAEGESFLVSMPTKFRKNVWIKRGDFVMVQPIEEGDKVKAEISHILYKPQISYIQQNRLWPPVFYSRSGTSADGVTMLSATSDSMIPDDMLPPSDDDDESCSDDDATRDCDKLEVIDKETNSDINVNPNRRRVAFDDSNEKDSDDSDDDKGYDNDDVKDR